jgi:DNA helicase-2/ATP-dependent DNA helicase PcrA
MQFTEPQQRAIEHGGRSLQLIACAGSGKTEVVARRVVHLLTPGRPDSLQPRNIVAFTFTEKAAAELKDRIVTRTREALVVIPGMAELFVGTIHAFCLELLKTETTRFSKHEVLNEIQQRLFVDRNSAQSGLTTSTDLNGRRLRRHIDTKRYIDAISILREADLNFEKLEECSVVKGFNAYTDLLAEKKYLDYSSILEEALATITDDKEIRSRVSERLKYVIVDEYQDVNPIQEAIVDCLHELGAGICVVGDDDQTIYQWRGSNVENILTFASRYPDVTQISLEDNFRSSEGVVLAARQFIQQNASRLPKQMKPTEAQGFESGDIVSLEFRNPDEEARHIATTAASLRGVAIKDRGEERGISWSDMAILLRSVKGNATPITKAFDQAGIPYVVTGMTNLFGTHEAEAARKLFYFLTDHVPREGVATDKESLQRAWRDARLGIAPNDLAAAVADMESIKRGLWMEGQSRWSSYSLQRTFMRFLESAGIREERVPNNRGEIVFYNLGKFSQVISDFETINFHSAPLGKYESFSKFLEFQAEDAYPEGWQDNRYANPDAVRIMTVHQAKGMEWPVVFLPALIRNRFPAAGVGGATVWHLIPEDSVNGQERYRGSIEDERRLFYVAMTRSQKFLHITWAPVPGSRRFSQASDFWTDVQSSQHVSPLPPDYTARKRLPPQTKKSVANVAFSFSDLKYFLECPYQFKLRVLYGFNAPIHEALGYGRSLHGALAEIHGRSIQGEVIGSQEASTLMSSHLHVPYSYFALRQSLEAAGSQVLANYLRHHGRSLQNLEVSEQPVTINLGQGVSVSGRIDLVRKIDTGESSVVDFKSSARAQPEDITEAQLNIYALGYEELTGRRPDYVEIYDLDTNNRIKRTVDDTLIKATKDKARAAAESLRQGDLRPAPETEKCSLCDYRGMCSARRD